MLFVFVFLLTLRKLNQFLLASSSEKKLVWILLGMVWSLVAKIPRSYHLVFKARRKQNWIESFHALSKEPLDGRFAKLAQSAEHKLELFRIRRAVITVIIFGIGFLGRATKGTPKINCQWSRRESPFFANGAISPIGPFSTRDFPLPSPALCICSRLGLAKMPMHGKIWKKPSLKCVSPARAILRAVKKAKMHSWNSF